MTHILEIFIDRTAISTLKTSLVREGDRGIDQCQFTVRKDQSVSINQRVELIYDLISVEGLVAYYGFQGGVKDESTKLHHGTATSLTYTDETEFFGKQAIFNGTTSFVSIPDTNNLDLLGVFDIMLWAKWSSTTEQFILSKRSTTSNGLALSVNAVTAGDVKFMIGSSSITSSSAGFNDGNKHLIRIKRDSDNLITLYIDDVSKGTVTSSYDPTNTNVLLMGKDFGGSFFAGKLLRIRIYKGENKTTDEATKIFTSINPRNILKFGGYVTKMDLELTHTKITALSYGKILAETDVRGDVFDNQQVETIVESLITNNTSFTFNDRELATGITIDQFLSDGKLIDIIRDFASISNRIFYTTPNEEFFFEPASFTSVSTIFTHGSRVIIGKSAYDDAQLVNSITLIGSIIEYKTNKTFSGNGTTTLFALDYSATSLEVQVGGVIKTPDIDYILDSLNKEVLFTVAPIVGVNNVSIEYFYEIPNTVKGEKPSSIAQYGLHSKTFNLSWIFNRTDGVRFIQSYLGRYSKVNQNISLRFGEPILYINENDILNVVNDYININGTFAVKSITWNYPELNTEIVVGEYRFDYFENEKEIIRKLHDYESNLTKTKEVEDYESPEEIIVLGDIFIQYVESLYTETLNISDTKIVHDKSVATYGGGSSYGSYTTGDVYAWLIR